MAKAIRKEKTALTAMDNHSDEDLSKKKTEEPLNLVDAYSALQKSRPELTTADMMYEILTFCSALRTRPLGHFTAVHPGENDIVQIVKVTTAKKTSRDLWLFTQGDLMSQTNASFLQEVLLKGTDTMVSATASCLLALAQFPDIQERLYQEVSSVVGLDDDVTLQDLNRMPYLDQVIKETLRWSNAVPFILRKVTKDMILSTCTIPSGNTIGISLFGIHMDHNIYPDPLKFDPERFSKENPNVNEKFTFVPFSGGPRNCIGKTYAMHLMKIMVVHVIRKYKLKTEMDISKLRKKWLVILYSADGYYVTLENRK